MLKRRQLSVTTQAIPTGGVDDPDKANVYMANGATDPGPTHYHLQSTDALTVRTLVTYNSGGAADGGGTPFPGGTGAVFRSYNGTTYIHGDGSAAIPALTGNMQATGIVGGTQGIRLGAVPVVIVGTTGNQTTGAEADITGCTTTFTPAVAEYAIVTVSATLQAGGTNSTILVYLTVDGVDQAVTIQYVAAITSGRSSCAMTYVVPLTAAVHTLKLRCASSGTASTVVRDYTTMTILRFAQ
jgi:hypothetical protein